MVKEETVKEILESFWHGVNQHDWLTLHSERETARTDGTGGIKYSGMGNKSAELITRRVMANEVPTHAEVLLSRVYSALSQPAHSPELVEELTQLGAYITVWLRDLQD